MKRLTARRTIGPKGRACPNCGHEQGGQVTLLFSWHGGQYVEVAEPGREPKEVVYVEFQDETFDQATLERIVKEWLDENGRGEIARQVREDWRYW